MQYWGVQEFVQQGFEYLMDMDHLDRSTKIDTIAKMLGSGKSRNGTNQTGVPEQRFIEEMAKCDAVCRNCHALRTHDKQHHLVSRDIICTTPTLFD